MEGKKFNTDRFNAKKILTLKEKVLLLIVYDLFSVTKLTSESLSICRKLDVCLWHDTLTLKLYKCVSFIVTLAVQALVHVQILFQYRI